MRRTALPKVSAAAARTLSEVSAAAAARTRPARAIVRLSLLGFALASSAAMAQPQPSAPVQVAVAESGGVSESFVLTGSLSAERSARLSPRADGLVRTVHVDAGDRVEDGQLLLELDDTLGLLARARAEAEVVQAAASEAEAQRRVQEAEPLVAARSLPQTELAARRAALAQAAAALQAAQAESRQLREEIDRHRLIAPFAGVISERMAEAGEWVSRGTPVLQLVALDSIRLDVQAPQERFDELKDTVPVGDRAGHASGPAAAGAHPRASSGQRQRRLAHFLAAAGGRRR